MPKKSFYYYYFLFYYYTGSRYSYRVRGSRRAAPPGSGEKSAKSGWIVPPATTQIQSPGGKFECGNDGGGG